MCSGIAGARPSRCWWCWSATLGSGGTKRWCDRPDGLGAFVILDTAEDGVWNSRFSTASSTSGCHDPRVWSARSVERAHPMAWFLGSLTILWYS